MMIKVLGTPAAKGSLHCIGSRGRRNHVLIEQNAKSIDPWRRAVRKAGNVAVEKYGPLSGAIILVATFTVPRPKSVPLIVRPYPTSRSSGDEDKMLRLVQDALGDAGLYGDDSQIITGTGTKTYPDSPGIADRLDRPGVIIRIEQLT